MPIESAGDAYQSVEAVARSAAFLQAGNGVLRRAHPFARRGAAVPLLAFVIAWLALPAISRWRSRRCWRWGARLGAVAGGAPTRPAAARVLVGGSAALALSALVGEMVGAVGI